MLVRLLLVVAALIGAYFLIRRLRRFSWGAQGPRLAIAAGITALLLLLTVRGGAEIAVPLLTVLAPFLLRWLNASRPLPSPAAPAPAGSSGCSTVTTRFLSMELDHATGAMSGRVLEGRFARCSLRDLSLQDLLELWRECQSDPQSVAVLEAYLDRHAEVDWRERLRDADRVADPNRVPGTMDRAEAYQILGLQPGASREDIQSAYRRLIQRVHPDHGGSSYLAARLNQARDVLLGMGSS
jgi:hypothetical protein